MHIPPQPLSNLQQELLKLYSFHISDDDVLAIKSMLAHYFATKAEQEMERVWDERKLTAEDMVNWAEEHHRQSGDHEQRGAHS